jgi:hypothetical protein
MVAKSMNVDRLNQWLILVANLGVLVGIVFLSIEIRQNTTAIRGAAIQTAATLSREQMFVIAQDSELSRIVVLGSASPANLDPVEAFRLSYLIRSFWVGMQANYRQWVLGILPEEEWAYYGRVICVYYGAPSAHAQWQAERQMFIPEFVEVVEKCDSPTNEITEAG